MKKKIDKIIEVVIVVLMIILVLDVVWQVLSRYVNRLLTSQFDTQIPTPLYAFTDELAGFLLIWVALMGAAYGTGKKHHLAIDLLKSKLGDKGKIKLNQLINAIILFFAVGVLCIGGAWLCYKNLVFGQVSAAMQIPLGYVYLVLPFSGILISYYVIDDFMNQKNLLKQIPE
ncbi:MAG: TRAP transporter small permease subunit [Bacteroidetes bacterium]|jgi:TRAP-type C4-dicarboxylate transport system permease small subunit|nr:TRAP transporter small permease subunit [Bacteroidota bacterium]